MGDMRTAARRGRIRTAISFCALAGVALLVSHDAVFLVQAGPGAGLTDALRAAGHDYWGIASAVLTAAGLIVALFAAGRIHRLRRRASELGASPSPGRRPMRVLRTWAWLAVVVAAAFFVQENLEHLVSHGHLIGAGALAGPEYPLAMPVIAAVTLAMGIVGGVMGGTESALVDAIADALAGLRRRPAQFIGRTSRTEVTRESLLARRGASRAPPLMVVLA